jgi:hypothetical protein
MPFIKRCHEKIRTTSPREVTIIKIEDDEEDYQN